MEKAERIYIRKELVTHLINGKKEAEKKKVTSEGVTYERICGVRWLKEKRKK